MVWSDWMRSRVVNAVLAVALMVPMGIPSAFAFPQVDHLRQEPTRNASDALGAIGSDEVGGDTAAK